MKTDTKDLRGPDLIDACADYIDAHPQEFRMNDWVYEDEVCGTSRCFAGTALFLVGALEEEDVLGYRFKNDVKEEFCTGICDNYGGPAAKLLGLTPREADQYFYDMDLTSEKIRELARRKRKEAREQETL